MINKRYLQATNRGQYVDYCNAPNDQTSTISDTSTLDVSFDVVNLSEYDWLSMVLRLCQQNIGYTADGFYRSDDPTNSVKAPVA